MKQQSSPLNENKEQQSSNTKQVSLLNHPSPSDSSLEQNSTLPEQLKQQQQLDKKVNSHMLAEIVGLIFSNNPFFSQKQQQTSNNKCADEGASTIQEKFDTSGLENAIHERFFCFAQTKDNFNINSENKFVTQNQEISPSHLSSIKKQQGDDKQSIKQNSSLIKGTLISSTKNQNQQQEDKLNKSIIEIEDLNQQSDEQSHEMHNIKYLSKNSNKRIYVCNCRKSKCLKLYCDCFSGGELCNKDCKCFECFNNESSLLLRNEAIEHILEKNPQAFNTKKDVSNAVIASNNMKRDHSHLQQQENQQEQFFEQSLLKYDGCNCRKSKCQKKYCLCYQLQQKCTDKCKCIECNNFEDEFAYDHKKNMTPSQNSTPKQIITEQLNLQNKVTENQQQNNNNLQQVLQLHGYSAYSEIMLQAINTLTSQQQQKQQSQSSQLQQQGNER